MHILYTRNTLITPTSRQWTWKVTWNFWGLTRQNEGPSHVGKMRLGTATADSESGSIPRQWLSRVECELNFPQILVNDAPDVWDFILCHNVPFSNLMFFHDRLFTAAHWILCSFQMSTTLHYNTPFHPLPHSPMQKCSLLVMLRGGKPPLQTPSQPRYLHSPILAY